jgi:hypothetical protein
MYQLHFPTGWKPWLQDTAFRESEQTSKRGCHAQIASHLCMKITHNRFKTMSFMTTVSKSTPSCRCFPLLCFQCGCKVSVMLFFTVVTAGLISCTNEKQFEHGTQAWQLTPLIETRTLHGIDSRHRLPSTVANPFFRTGLQSVAIQKRYVNIFQVPKQSG